MIRVGKRPRENKGATSISDIVKVYLKWLNPNTDTFYTGLVEAGRIPVVSNCTLQMQSDAIEPDKPVSNPGAGNNGKPTDPGDPPTVPTDPPTCSSTLNCGESDTNPGGGPLHLKETR